MEAFAKDAVPSKENTLPLMHGRTVANRPSHDMANQRGEVHQTKAQPRAQQPEKRYRAKIKATFQHERWRRQLHQQPWRNRRVGEILQPRIFPITLCHSP